MTCSSKCPYHILQNARITNLPTHFVKSGALITPAELPVALPVLPAGVPVSVALALVSFPVPVAVAATALEFQGASVMVLGVKPSMFIVMT